MNRATSIVLIVIGVILFSWGITASESFSSEISRIFTGTPTDRAIFLLISGIFVGGIGLAGLLFGRK